MGTGIMRPEKMPGITLRVKRLPGCDDIPLPRYMTAHAAGMDICAAVQSPVSLLPGMRAMIPTGIAVALPEGTEAQVRPRSGLAAKHGITLLNSPGTIDADYRGEIKVLMINHGDTEFTINRGDRIAQIVVQPVLQASLLAVDELPESTRNDGGFGHTGA